MPNLTDLSDFLLRELDTNIVTNAYGESRYLDLATPIEGNLGGKRFPILGNPVAGIVANRGGNKPVSRVTTTHLDVDPVEFAVQIPFHKDSLNVEGLENLASRLAVQAAGAIALSADVVIDGGTDAYGTVAPVNFGTYKNAATLPVTTRAEWFALLKGTLADGRSADGAVITEGLWLDLSAAASDLGVPTFNIVGDHKNGGSINGLAVRTIPGTGSTGVIGALTSGARGGIPFGLDYEVQTMGTIDVGGTPINLNETNHYSLRVSGNIFYNYFNLANYKRIAVVAA